MRCVLSKVKIESMFDVMSIVSQWRATTRLSRQPHERDQKG
jgi:hypothetical protein